MESSTNNIILLTDSYKVTHWPQYPEGTKHVYSYFESRGGEYPYTVFFGLQYFLKKYLTGWVVTHKMIDEAKELFALHFGNDKLFNEACWRYIVEEHYGRLPVSIKAVPEGTKVPVSNVLMTIENTDPKCYWLTNYLETLLVQCWYPTTVATQSHAIKQNILAYLEKTGDPAGIGFKLHDFGFRGVSSPESAGIGGAAHLVNFMGTDTVAALKIARDYYGCKMAGYSIPASEHSTITSWGQLGEMLAYDNMLNKYPEGLVACVSDSFDIINACDKIWGEQLRDKVLSRNGTLVIRPDSGDPASTVLKVMQTLEKRFPVTVNDKGYKVLDSHVRVIQGDGVNSDSIFEILGVLWQNGFSADNIAFGMGGALLQKLDRDTQKFAFKCAAVNVRGEEREVFKKPVTDPSKNSKAGKLKLIKTPEGLKTVKSAGNPEEDLLVEVFRDGELTREYSFDEVRANANV